jgi:hypothetical protein
MKFFYSLIVYVVSIVITLSIIIVFVSGQSNSGELKIYTYYEGKFLVHYPSNYIVEPLENTFNTTKETFATSRPL